LEMDITMAQDNNVTLLQDWKNFYKPYCRLIDVPADGMCGWFCLAVSAQYFTDNPLRRREDGTGWKQHAWKHMSFMRNAVVEEVLNACKTLSKKSDPQANQEAEHVLVGFHPDPKRSKPTTKDKFRYVETTARKLLKNSTGNRPYDLNTWFGNQWGNVVAKVIKRQVVVVGENVGGKDNVVFTLHTPRYLKGYSFTDFGEGTPRMGGTSYALLKDLKKAIEEVNLDFSIVFPPVWLHYNAATSHFKYYSEKRPPPMVTNMARLHESTSGDSSTQDTDQAGGGEVVSGIFGKAVKSQLQGMNAKTPC
jgi:hypothetical protein